MEVTWYRSGICAWGCRWVQMVVLAGPELFKYIVWMEGGCAFR